MSNPVPDPPGRTPDLRRKLLSFAVVALLCGGTAVGYLVWRATADPSAPAGHLADAAAGTSTGLTPMAATVPAGALVMFIDTALGASYGRVSWEVSGAPAGARTASPMQCERVHFAADRGVCLQAKRGVFTTYSAVIFDRSFRVLHTLALAGAPSRARMSADGRLAAMTVFVTGHSYASGNFSTRTSIVDTHTGEWVVDDLERLELIRDGRSVRGTDFNFWGVTFSRQSGRFFATLGTEGRTFLVEGDLDARRMQVLDSDVECPSLSPDERRIAFKRRRNGEDGRVQWGIEVLDRESGRRTALGLESKNVDDQVEWLDDGTVAYALPASETQASATTHLWAIGADGSSPPRLVIRNAASAARVTHDR